MKKHILKKISILVLCATILNVVPTTVFAANEDVFKGIPKSLEKPELPDAPTLKKTELPDIPSLKKSKLPDIDFKRPENMPDINIDISSEHNTVMNDLKNKGFGNVTLNLDQKGLDFSWSKQGNNFKLSDQEFKEYLNNAEQKYLPQINASKNSASGLKYDKIDLSSKWDLMSYNEAKNKSSSLPDYNVLKDNLKSSVSMPTLERATLSYSTPSEFNEIKNSIISNSNNRPPSTMNYSNLPKGLSVNSDGTISDTRAPISIPDTIGYAAGNLIGSLPEVFSGFGDGVSNGWLGRQFKSVLGGDEKQKILDEEINKIR